MKDKRKIEKGKSEWEKERKKESKSVWVGEREKVKVCVCVWEREREREKERKKERERICWRNVWSVHSLLAKYLTKWVETEYFEMLKVSNDETAF